MLTRKNTDAAGRPVSRVRFKVSKNPRCTFRVNRAYPPASHVRPTGYYTIGIQKGYSAITLLEFNHMRSLRNNETPFLTGLGIEPENPWVTGGHRRKLKGKSGLVTLELCAGAGGQAIGLERAGIDHVGLLEIDALACSTLRQNRPKWNVIEQDLDTFDAAAFAGADIVSAGLPCPPFSIAGKQLGTLDERNLFPAMIRVVDQVRPRAVMVENVRGIPAPTHHCVLPCNNRAPVQERSRIRSIPAARN
jgi:C-5 cytosine-specific DNA methylase